MELGRGLLRSKQVPRPRAGGKCLGGEGPRRLGRPDRAHLDRERRASRPPRNARRRNCRGPLVRAAEHGPPGGAAAVGRWPGGRRRQEGGKLPACPTATPAGRWERYSPIGALILGQGTLTQARIDDLRADLAEVRADVRRLDDRVQRLDDRLRAVEIAFGRAEQRLETLERVILPVPDPAE